MIQISHGFPHKIDFEICLDLLQILFCTDSGKPLKVIHINTVTRNLIYSEVFQDSLDWEITRSIYNLRERYLIIEIHKEFPTGTKLCHLQLKSEIPIDQRICLLLRISQASHHIMNLILYLLFLLQSVFPKHHISLRFTQRIIRLVDLNDKMLPLIHGTFE